MKRIVCLIFLFFPTLLFAQKVRYTIEGTLEKINVPLKIYLVCQTNDGFVVDSAMLIQGGFSFKGSLKKPSEASLIIDHEGAGLKSKSSDMLPLYLDGEAITIRGVDSIRSAHIVGYQVSVDYQKFLGLLAPIQVRMDNLMAKTTGGMAQQTREGKAELQRQFDVIQADQKMIFVDFIKSHMQHVIGLDVLKALGGNPPNVSEVEPLFNLFTSEIKNSEAGKVYGETLRQLKVTALGVVAPEFSQNDIDGKPITLSSLRGKYVLVDFWASWCGPCRQENPRVVKVFNEFKSKKFTILGVSLDKNKDSWLNAIKSDQLTWTHVSDLRGWQNEAAQLYNVKSIPQNFLLDPNGMIIAKNLHEGELIEKLQEIFK